MRLLREQKTDDRQQIADKTDYPDICIL